MDTPSPSHDVESGLLLQFPDGQSLALTPRTIEERSRAVLADCVKVSPTLLQMQAFQLCTVCPKRGSGDTCHAIRPILAFFEHIDRYFSYQKVTAIYRAPGTKQTIVSEATMSQALQYLSVLSLLQYCETGKKYWKYFYDVHPLMDIEDVVVHVYLNMFWACGGDVEKTRALIARFHEEISATTQCQLDRLRLVCTHDAFLNALILTQLASEFLASNVEEIIARRFSSHAAGER